ncbi:MAG: glycosyltransferase [Bdellovibrionales bacterium]|nr:glycosyltransferase [Bdellovibrionales bacterium]
MSLVRPLKVLHCITDLPAHGAQRMLLKLIEGLDSSAFENHVVSLVPGGTLTQEFLEKGIPLCDLGMKRGVPTLSALLQLRKIIKEFQPDIIQGWLYHGNLVASLAALISGNKVPVVWNIRRALYGLGDDKWLTRNVIRAGAWLSWHPKLILHNAEVSVQQHVDFGYAEGKHAVISNCFRTDQFKPDAEARLNIRTELGIAADETLVGIVGRFHPQKDYRNFCQAAASVALQGAPVQFVMVGDNVVPENATIRMWLSDAFGDAASDYLKRFHMLGPRDDIPAIMASIDVYCSSSANEGFPNVVGEAMSCGVPCVVTDAGATGELVHGVGAVVARKDSKALSRALLDFVVKEPLERQSIGRSARERVLEHYSLEAIAQQYISCYRTLVAEQVS